MSTGDTAASPMKTGALSIADCPEAVRIAARKPLRFFACSLE